MTHNATFIGIDLSKDIADVKILPGKTKFRASIATEKQRRQLARKLAAYRDLLGAAIVMEGTGSIERLVALALEEENLPVAIVNPRQVRDFARGIGQLAKTDRIDAHVLAHFAKTVEPNARMPHERSRAVLRDVVDRRDQLKDIILAEKNRLQKTLSSSIAQSIKKHLKWLERELEKVEAELKSLVEESPDFAEKARIIKSPKGIGLQTTAILLALLPELGTLGEKEIAALAGLAPYARESGKWKGKRQIFGGRRRVRKALYMAALSAGRKGGIFHDFKQRLLDAGKSKKAANIAVARKLLVMLNALVRDGRLYEEKVAHEG